MPDPPVFEDSSSALGMSAVRRCSSSCSSAAANTLPQLPILNQSQCTMDEVLQLLRQLYTMSAETKREKLKVII